MESGLNEGFQSTVKQRTHATDFKAEVALSAIRGDSSLAELASRYHIHPNMIAKWKLQALAGMKEGFGRNAAKGNDCREAEIKALQANVDELLVERDFLSKAFDR